jgi:hypothetical protein
MAIQSTEEVIRIFDEWGRHHAPSSFIQNEKNAKLLLDHVLKTYGLVSITYLTEAANALGSQLDLIPELTPAQIEANLAAKSEARMRRDLADSKKPQHTLEQVNLSQQRLDANKKTANEKEYKTVLAQIDREISEVVIGHASGHQDYSRTDSAKQTLREVRDQHNRSTINGARTALTAVRAAKSKL